MSTVMAEELYDVLNRFHREVLRPDMQAELARFHREVVRPDMEQLMDQRLARFHRETVIPDVERIIGERLARFHEETVIPDIERIVDERVGAKIAPLRDEMLGGFDHIETRLDHLTTEYHAVKVGLERVETRTAALEAKHGR